jgi:hypothetical protein
MKVRFSLPLLVCSLTYFFFTALLTVFFAGLLAGSLAVCGADRSAAPRGGTIASGWQWTVKHLEIICTGLLGK